MGVADEAIIGVGTAECQRRLGASAFHSCSIAVH